MVSVCAGRGVIVRLGGSSGVVGGRRYRQGTTKRWTKHLRVACLTMRRRATRPHARVSLGGSLGDPPGDHSWLAICTLRYSVVPLGTASALGGGRSSARRDRSARNETKRSESASWCTKTTMEGPVVPGRTARLAREREYRQHRRRLAVPGGVPRRRHPHLLGADRAGRPRVLPDLSLTFDLPGRTGYRS